MVRVVFGGSTRRAASIAGRLPLYTCNPGDFVGIPELDLNPVPHPDHLTPGSTG